MTEEKVTKKFRFKWVTCSPDPHNVTMRNTLEPEEIYVLVDIPVRLLVNASEILKGDLGVDIPKKDLELTLTPEAMKYAIEQLSLQEVIPDEELSDEAWDDEDEESMTVGDDEDWDDENWEDE
jgi:hypothetical protein